MTDRMTPDERSRHMKRVRQKNTAPELRLRSALHARGLRYRLHPNELPGRPDLVFPGGRLAVFVHGCFWHGHDCRAGRAPSSNTEYWGPKIEANRERDARKERELREAGWDVETVWECELKSIPAPTTIERVAERVRRAYGTRRKSTPDRFGASDPTRSGD